MQIYVDRGLDEDLARKVWRPASCNRGNATLGHGRARVAHGGSTSCALCPKPWLQTGRVGGPGPMLPLRHVLLVPGKGRKGCGRGYSYCESCYQILRKIHGDEERSKPVAARSWIRKRPTHGTCLTAFAWGLVFLHETSKWLNVYHRIFHYIRTLNSLSPSPIWTA